MKIAVIVRTLNEEKNIRRFCDVYLRMFNSKDLLLRILVADGGSTDGTKDTLNTYTPIVRVKDFTEQIEIHSRGVTHNVNPRGRHINFLIDWAKSVYPDWIIFDDVDCVPSREFQKSGIQYLDDMSDMVYAYRLFMLGTNRYFSGMNKKHDGQSLWAWRPFVPIRAKEDNDLVFEMEIPKIYKDGCMIPVSRLDRPYSLLHYFYPDEETFQRKKAQYVATGEVPKWYDPMVQFGRIEDAPEWAVWQ